MLTLAFYAILAVLLGCAIFLVAALLLPAGEQIAPPIRDEPPWDLPAGRHLGAVDVAELRLPVALRGYRFAETDLLLDRLADELRDRDQEISRLRGLGPVFDPGTPPAADDLAPDDGEPHMAQPPIDATATHSGHLPVAPGETAPHGIAPVDGPRPSEPGSSSRPASTPRSEPAAMPSVAEPWTRWAPPAGEEPAADAEPSDRSAGSAVRPGEPGTGGISGE